MKERIKEWLRSLMTDDDGTMTDLGIQILEEDEHTLLVKFLCYEEEMSDVHCENTVG